MKRYLKNAVAYERLLNEYDGDDDDILSKDPESYPCVAVVHESVYSGEQNIIEFDFVYLKDFGRKTKCRGANSYKPVLERVVLFFWRRSLWRVKQQYRPKQLQLQQ